MFCNNDIVVRKSSRPGSALKKKSLNIYYLLKNDAVTCGIIRIERESGEKNVELFSLSSCWGQGFDIFMVTS